MAPLDWLVFRTYIDDDAGLLCLMCAVKVEIDSVTDVVYEHRVIKEISRFIFYNQSQA